MPTHLTRNSHPRKASDVRRNLFRTLSRSNSSTTASAAAAAAAAAATSTAGSAPAAGAGSPFDSDDGIVVRNEDGSLDGGQETQMLMMMVAGMNAGGEAGREAGDQERLAEMVKRHHNDMARKLPELLRQKVRSLAEDEWMFNAEADD
ncbi:hypothetical protein BDZ91DRAFT_790345 [Kalaharituber pfeilii]|nr:hypothetical protein BDZ91DRAFT_790345 [Kalaharituber pfeilii]